MFLGVCWGVGEVRLTSLRKELQRQLYRRVINMIENISKRKIIYQLRSMTKLGCYDSSKKLASLMGKKLGTVLKKVRNRETT